MYNGVARNCTTDLAKLVQRLEPDLYHAFSQKPWYKSGIIRCTNPVICTHDFAQFVPRFVLNLYHGFSSQNYGTCLIQASDLYNGFSLFCTMVFDRFVHAIVTDLYTGFCVFCTQGFDIFSRSRVAHLELNSARRATSERGPRRLRESRLAACIVWVLVYGGPKNYQEKIKARMRRPKFEQRRRPNVLAADR